uniref:TNT domain-containing protein n=1 Tax=Mycena chlorophos TaxID=658473 RepID=A0ABQ0LRC1_MYCCL|nr:predicted protein [Mycena chlorophos]
MLQSLPATVLLLLVGGTWLAAAAPVLQPTNACACEGTAYNASLTDVYVCGDYRLGPTVLALGLTDGNTGTTHKPSRSDAIVEALLGPPLGYHRFGEADLCPKEWLAQFTNAATGYYIYPADDGFQLQETNTAISGTQRLAPGMLLDRFGRDSGSYLAPFGTPFAQRALPPASLNPPFAQKPQVATTKKKFEYHVYRVQKSFEVEAGPIAAWFGQPGQGTQYYMPGKSVVVWGPLLTELFEQSLTRAAEESKFEAAEA